jgi:uroporphyrinogen decarboxylase
MKSIDRINASIRFERTDRVPVFPHLYGLAARLKNVPLKDYLNNGELLATCQLEAWKRFGYDAVAAFADNSLEAEALGSKLFYQDDAYPHIEKYALDHIGDWKHLTMVDPEKAGRMPVVLEACRILKHETGEQAAVVGTVLGPMTIAGQLLGIEKLIFSVVDHPKHLYHLLNFTTQVMLTFGKALLNAGAHVIQIFDPFSSCSVINRAVFKEYILPHLKTAFKEYKETANPICWLNITGQTKPILDLFPETGADVINIDYLVDLDFAMKKLPHLCINGNIKPFSFISDEPKDIQTKAKSLLRQTRLRGGFVLSPGCEIPLESKENNVNAMMKAVKSESKIIDGS